MIGSAFAAGWHAAESAFSSIFMTWPALPSSYDINMFYRHHRLTLCGTANRMKANAGQRAGIYLYRPGNNGV